MKPTKSLLAKLENLLETLEYKIRYERGNFKSGYCLLDEQNVIVINKFYPIESKVKALTEILQKVQPDLGKLDSAQQKFLQKINQTEIKF